MTTDKCVEFLVFQDPGEEEVAERMLRKRCPRQKNGAPLSENCQPVFTG